MVIVDTPPMLAVSDAAVVGRYVGTSLLVARFALNVQPFSIVCRNYVAHAGLP